MCCRLVCAPGESRGDGALGRRSPRWGRQAEPFHLLHEWFLGENPIHLWMSIGGIFGVASFLKASLRDRVWPCGDALPLVGEDGLGWKWSGGGGDSSVAVLGGAEGSWLLFGCGSAFVVRW